MADTAKPAATPTIIQACLSSDLFARWFKRPETWAAWFVFLKVLFGLELTAEDVATFQELTGRTDVPTPGVAAREAWLVVGRRGGKSLILSVIAVYLACFVDWSPYLVGGERATIIVIAQDRKAARTIFRYISAFLKDTMLAGLVERETSDSIDLINQVTIEISTASFKSVRGY
jgi:hypothetical protein